MKNKTKLNLRIQRNNNLNDIVYDDTAGPGNGRHHYQVFLKGNEDTVASPLLDIQFQEGPRKDPRSVSGVLETDLLEIVRHRLQCFQLGEYHTDENAFALMHIEEALMWLNKRVEDRAERGVLGTMNK
ncbi:MAG: ABC transporter ATPase [Clostridiales bacterium]|nr:ABC transporter ATPase [Clostridiales bacterium]